MFLPETISIRTVHKQSSLPVDEPVPVKTSRSPPRRKESNVVHVMNLVRPFTLNQLKELLGKYGTLVADGGFWMDKIKSHCFVAVSHCAAACFLQFSHFCGVCWYR